MAATSPKSLLELAQQYALPGIEVSFRIVGRAPGLLMHNPDAKGKNEQAAVDHSSGGKKGKFIPSPEDEAEWGAYRFEDGHLRLPAHALRRCLVESGKKFIVPKKRYSFSTMIASGLVTPSEYQPGFPLLDPVSGRQLKDYTLNVQRAVVNRAGIDRARPLIEEWAAEGVFEVDTDAVPLEVFAQVFGYAGARQGLLDFRPEKGGEYGLFTIEQLEIS